MLTSQANNCCYVTFHTKTIHTRAHPPRQRPRPAEIVVAVLALAFVAPLEVVAHGVGGAVVVLGGRTLVKVLDAHAGHGDALEKCFDSIYLVYCM